MQPALKMLPSLTLAACICLLQQFAQAQGEAAQSLEQQLLAEPATNLAAAARREGNPTRGAAIFFGRALACSTCHSVGDRSDSMGPDVTRIDKKTTDAALVESILTPSKTIAPGYATVTIETVDGQILSGLLVEETAAHIVLRNAAQPDKLITLKKQDIADRQAANQSLMPSGQVNQLADRQQFLDLVRFLIELREGGVERARHLQPPTDPLALKVPDAPLPWQPVVQRGEVALGGGARFPRGVALGFVGGTVLFDADQLGTAAVWYDGFVKSSPQTYFGLYWQRDGGAPENPPLAPHSLRLKLSSQGDWESFETPSTSDPNVGSRFDGYQIGKTAVRLRYRVLIGKQRIAVIEDVRAESRPDWQGFVRKFQFSGLPAGAQVALALPAGEQFQFYGASGEKKTFRAEYDVETRANPRAEPGAMGGEVGQAPLLGYRAGGAHRVARAQSLNGAKWLAEDLKGKLTWRLVSEPVREGALVSFRIDMWKYRGRNPAPGTAELAVLEVSPPVIEDAFDQPLKPAKTLPTVEASPAEAQANIRPAVNPRENSDEFPTATGRFLRFSVTRTNDKAEPGIDELEVYGTNSKVNLAPRGKAGASSVISGYPIHQIPHLNDGKLGNPNSWISAEAGRGWVQIEFPELVEMRKIVWARDRTGICKDRLAVAYRIEVSGDGKHWTKVGDESGRASPQAKTIAVRRDASPGYVMEAIPAPFSGCRPSDIAFADDGTMYVIAMTEGQVWRTQTPPAGHPERVKWERFAVGLHHPIGLAVVNGRIYVSQKPEITELIDRDGDGTVDQYRTVATGWGLSIGFHEYTFGLAVDPQQNLWFALNTGRFWTHPGADMANAGRWRGSVLRVTHGEEKLEIMAKGCRVPNGISKGPDGNIFFTDNQGDWIQACKLAQAIPGRFYGHPEYTADALPKGALPNGLSAVWFPYNKDSSSGTGRSISGPTCDLTQGKFGPFADQMFVGDVGYGINEGIFRVALEKIGGEYQGACFRFIEGQPQGCERMKFGPDNQLYMASLTSGVTRLAFDGKTPLAIRSLRIRPKGEGFVVQLTKPLAAHAKLNPADFRVRRYHHLYTGNYGSPEADAKTIPVQAAELSSDRTAITLSFPVETYPSGMVYEINVGKLSGADGEKLRHHEAWYTVQKIPE
ncbi:MAG: hypothetical protein K8T91_10255 [Planctomycetes bacterium]|nr:hypothetical protein [Planctomycetota bacterium]